MRTHTEGRRAGARPGMTLIELMISMLLLSAVMGTILTVVMRQQRFYRSASEIMETRGQLRSATAILPVELRGVSTRVRDASGAVVDSDILSMSANAVEFRSTFGAGIVCENAAGTVSLYPVQPLASGLLLGGFLYTPEPGDVMFMHNGGDAGITDDTWERHTISTASSGAACTTGLAAGTAADLALPRPRFTFATTPSTGIAPGAPVRIARTVRYELDKDASGDWYLYQSRRNEISGAWEAKQPVAGPYLEATGNPATSGLYFRYVDVNGNPITANDLVSRQSVTRIDITVRGETASDVQGSGFGSGNKPVLQSISVAIRNRT